MNVVGISAHFHDAACCLIVDGELVAAAEEERFSRRKHDPALPSRAWRYCLEQAGLSVCDIDVVAYYEDPVKKLERQLWSCLRDAPSRGLGLPGRFDPRRPVREIRDILGYDGPIETVSHHEAHAASAYFFSGFSSAAVLVVDAVGEWATTSYWRAIDDELDLVHEVLYPHSLGLLYSVLTSYLGFAVNDDEYKVMGLAAYGRPVFADRLRKLIDSPLGPDFRLNLDYFDFANPERMYTDALVDLLGHQPLEPGAEPDTFAQDVAASVQRILEEVLLDKARYLHEWTSEANLCMAGGVALNCVANGLLARKTPFERLFVQPAAGDAGGALGAAALAYRRNGGLRARRRPLRSVLLGPDYDDAIPALLTDTDMPVRDCRGSEDDLIQSTVDYLAKGAVVGWFQGRMEFGPRALGARSILGDPRNPGMRDRINAMIKKREGFRPFAPAVLATHAPQHFALDHSSPFMLETCEVISPLELPAVRHVDGSARVQTVHADDAPRLHRLLSAFNDSTGCPMLLNTSFNVMGEPIVCSPTDALLTFLRSGLDFLVLGDFILDRSRIPRYWLEYASRKTHVPTAGIPRGVYAFI